MPSQISLKILELIDTFFESPYKSYSYRQMIITSKFWNIFKKEPIVADTGKTN